MKLVKYAKEMQQKDEIEKKAAMMNSTISKLDINKIKDDILVSGKLSIAFSLLFKVLILSRASFGT